MQKWDGIFEATKYGPECAQKMWITNQNVGDENCLHLQVFTPSVSLYKDRKIYDFVANPTFQLTDNLPVMVYYHGGGFTIGSGNSLQPQYFMDENVVLVLVNYRLGPFG